MKPTPFNPKDSSKQRRQETNTSQVRDIEPSKLGASQIERRTVAQEDNYSIQPQSELVFEKFVVDPVRHNPEMIKQLSLEDEIDDSPSFSHNQKNTRINTSLKSSQQNDSQIKLNNSQNLNSDIYVLDAVSERELPEIIRKICQEAYELGMAGNDRKSFERLEKAEQLIRKYKIEDPFTQYELIFFIFHNMTAVSYNLSLLLEAQMYAEGSLANFEFLKKIRKPNRPYNFQLLSDQNEYIMHRMKKMLAKKFICKTNLQICIILSEFQKHKEAAQYAKRATKISCNLIVDKLILCYYILYKATARKDNSKPAEYYGVPKGQQPGQNRPFEEQLRARKFVKNSTFDFNSNPALDDSKSSINSKDSYLSNQHIQREPTVDPNEASARKLIPILEEIVQRIKPQKYFSYWSKRDRILAYYRHYFKEMHWDTPDLGHLYAEIKEHAKLRTLNLLNVIKITMVSPSKISLGHPTLETELEAGNIFEKILLVVTGFYTLSTETRFIHSLRGLNPQPLELSPEKAQIEDWLSKSVEIGYMFLPMPLALMDQVIPVYKNFYGIHNQMIPEEEELSHENKYLKTLRGGFRVDAFIPIVRYSNEEEMFKGLFTPQEPYLHEKVAPEFETTESRRNATREDFSVEEYSPSKSPQQVRSQSRGSEFRSTSNEKRKETSFFKQFNQDQEMKRANLENMYQNLRPSSKSSNTQNEYTIPKGAVQQQPIKKEFEFVGLNKKPQPSRKINNFFSNNAFTFDRTDDFNNLGPRVQTEHLDPELQPESLTQPDMMERSFTSSGQRSGNQKRQRQPSPFLPVNINSELGSRQMKSNGFKGTDGSPISQKEHLRPTTSSKPRGNSRGLQQKGNPEQQTLLKDALKEDLLSKTVYVSSATVADNFAQKTLIKNTPKQAPQKFDIKINNNINFFINNQNTFEDIIAGSVGRKPQNARQFKPQPMPFEDALLQKGKLFTHKETERIKPRAPEIQRRAETDPDEHAGSNSPFFPDFSESLKIETSNVSKKRGKSPSGADNPFLNNKMNRSVPKRTNLSFSKDSELDKSDFLNRSAIEQGRARVSKNSAHSAERKPVFIQNSKVNQISELEKMLRSTKPISPSTTKESNSKFSTPNKTVERALFQYQPYLNTTMRSTNNNRPQEPKTRKLDEILRRDQLSKNIVKTRTKQNQDANDISIRTAKATQNEVVTLWDQMRANPKIFRTYDKS